MSYGNSTAAAGLSTDVATANGTNTPTLPKTSELPDDILARARVYAYDLGIALPEEDLVQVFTLPPERIREALDLAQEIREKWCGKEVELEGIVSLKTGGCPEDCHFCAQSGVFESPVRSAWIDIPAVVESAKHTAKTGAAEFCLVAAVRGPDKKLMSQLKAAVEAIRAEVDIHIACSLGMLTDEQADELAAMGIRRYNHNLETARSYFLNVVTSHTWEVRRATLERVRSRGIKLCCGGIIGLGESIEQRAEFATQLAELGPTEVPINFLNPRPGTPFENLPLVSMEDALRTVAAFRFALPKSTIRFAGGREITLGDEGMRDGLTGGINGFIAGNYLTTLGCSAENDLDMLSELHIPIREKKDVQ